MKRTKLSIETDKRLKAMHGGKRTSENGNTYYEYRENRSDANRTKKFGKGGDLWTPLDFTSIEEYFDYINDSLINGNRTQVASLYRDMDDSQKKQFFDYAEMQGESFDDIIDYINNKVRTYAKGGGVGKVTKYIVFYSQDGGMRERVFENEDEANTFSNKVSGSVSPIKLAKGGVLDEKESMLHFVLNQLPSGTVANMSSYSDYKTIDKIKSQIINILQEEGDVKYSIYNLKSLIKRAEDDIQEPADRSYMNTEVGKVDVYSGLSKFKKDAVVYHAERIKDGMKSSIFWIVNKPDADKLENIGYDITKVNVKKGEKPYALTTGEIGSKYDYYAKGGGLNNSHLDDLYNKSNKNVQGALELYAGELGIYNMFYGHKVDASKKAKYKEAQKYLESKYMAKGGGVEKNTDFYLVVNLDERGEYSADVRNPKDEVVYSIEDSEQMNSLIQDGFLKYKADEDLNRLTKYLMDLGIIPNNSQIYSEEEFDDKIREEYTEGDEDEEFVVHGHYTVSNSGGYEIMLTDSGDAARVRDAFGSDNPKTSDWLEIEYVEDENGEPDEDGNLPLEPVIDPQGYNIPLNLVMRSSFKKGGSVKQKGAQYKIDGYGSGDRKHKAKPVGFRYERIRDPKTGKLRVVTKDDKKYYATPTKKEIKAYKDGDATAKKMLGFELRKDHSDREPLRTMRKFAAGGSVTIGEYKATFKVKYSLDGDKQKDGYIVSVLTPSQKDIDYYLLYDKSKKLVKKISHQEGQQLVKDKKITLVKRYDVENEKQKSDPNTPVKEMGYAERREWINENIVPHLKSAVNYWNSYNHGSFDANDEKSNKEFLDKVRKSAMYGSTEAFEKATSLKVDDSGWGLESPEGEEFEEVASDNTYNSSYLGLFNWSFKIYSIYGERFVLMAHPHMGGDIRSNYGDPIFLEGESKEDVIYKFYEEVIDGKHSVNLEFKDGTSVTFDAQQDSDVNYYELYDDGSKKKKLKLGSPVEVLISTFKTFKGWSGDDFVESIVDEFNRSKPKKKKDGGNLGSYLHEDKNFNEYKKSLEDKYGKGFKNTSLNEDEFDKLYELKERRNNSFEKNIPIENAHSNKLKNGGDMYSDGGSLKGTSESDLEETAEYMAKAVKKRADLKDLIVYFEKDNNFDYKVRAKIWDDMNVWEMPKTYNNILKVLKEIVKGNKELGVNDGKYADGGTVDVFSIGDLVFNKTLGSRGLVGLVISEGKYNDEYEVTEYDVLYRGYGGDVIPTEESDIVDITEGYMDFAENNGDLSAYSNISKKHGIILNSKYQDAIDENSDEEEFAKGGELPSSMTGKSLSSGTLKSEHLIESFMDFLQSVKAELGIEEKVNNLQEEVNALEKDEDGDFVGESQETATYILNEDIFDLLNNIAPEGTSFGSHEGNGSDFGFWEYENDEEFARGGFVGKGELVWRKLSSSDRMNFLNENFTSEITPRTKEILVGKTFNFLPKNVKIKIEAKYANVEDYAKGGSLKKTKEKYVELLNEIGVPEYDHPENGGRFPYKHLNTYGLWLRKNDPIAFRVGYSDWASEDDYKKGGSVGSFSLKKNRKDEWINDSGQYLIVDMGDEYQAFDLHQEHNPEDDVIASDEDFDALVEKVFEYNGDNYKRGGRIKSMKQKGAQYERDIPYGSRDSAVKSKPVGYRYMRIIDKKSGRMRRVQKTDTEYYLTPTKKLIAAYEAGDAKVKKMLYFENRADHSDKKPNSKRGY